ncbi:hypothetical protein IFM89_023111 [Coptis chinensis]|uniref:phosphopyruvate hydratase n=1 Tax=Coptis chinensis TaxID=261450 RepID=A0A835HZ87_9MAGN|nr:hypothetical protein IFM89_023111 [Coptis chinensis]
MAAGDFDSRFKQDNTRDSMELYFMPKLESIQAALDSKAAGWGVMVSHRSGETEDNFIADLSVGLASGQLFSIEEELGNVVVIFGEAFRSP